MPHVLPPSFPRVGSRSDDPALLHRPARVVIPIAVGGSRRPGTAGPPWPGGSPGPIAMASDAEAPAPEDRR
jgi:hypothetical protein